MNGVVLLVGAETAGSDGSLIGSGAVGIGVETVGSMIGVEWSRVGVEGSRIDMVGCVWFLVRLQVFKMHSFHSHIYRG